MATENGNTVLGDEEVLEAIFNPEAPIGGIPAQVEADATSNSNQLSPEEEQVKELELLAVKKAEADQLHEALELLNHGVSMVPGYASVYNNRAQVLRLLNRVDEALSDLDRALELSGGHGQTSKQAYAQRGLIRLLQEDEEGALKDFKAAADLGSQFARGQLIKMNPYSKLCNQMLSAAITKLKEGTRD